MLTTCYRPQMKWRTGNVFTPVSHSVRGVYPSMQWAVGVSPLSPGGVEPLGKHPLDTHRPRAHTPPRTNNPLPETANEAGGTHPIGMHYY